MTPLDSIPPILIEGFLRLCEGDFSHRLPRSLLRDEDDTAAFFFNAIAEELDRILTLSREQEQRLARSEENFRKLFDAAPVPMILVDEGGTVRTCNEQAAALLQADRDAVIGINVGEFFADEDEWNILFERLGNEEVRSTPSPKSGSAARQRTDAVVAAERAHAGPGRASHRSAHAHPDLTEQKRIEEIACGTSPPGTRSPKR